jgi:hypothetical protein
MGGSKGECMRREYKSQCLTDSKWNFLQNPIPYYFGSFNTNYIIFRNVKFFNKFFPQISKFVKENIESSKNILC